MTAFRYLVLVLCFGLFAGCSSRPAKEGDPVANDFQELNELLHVPTPSGRPPAKLADLDRHRTMFPKAYNAVKSGDVVVLWGTPTKGEGDVGKDEVVVAYQKNVPTEGGYVLMSAGTVTKMSAAEFASAPKAKK
jgi:hypothetical protein